MANTTTAHAHDDHDHKPHGLKRWLYATNHKDIGTMYLVFACVMFFLGGAMALVIRAELFQPGLQFVDPGFFNSMTTMHALLMIFGAVMPAWTGLANWMVPMQIGAPDMALPRLNNFSFWLLPFAFTLLLLTFGLHHVWLFLWASHDGHVWSLVLLRSLINIVVSGSLATAIGWFYPKSSQG